ncbi:SDR family NAD(P)-dependent oxidoreductase [Mycobacteroides abscessus]|nr:SDR family NAD(P)-dependent oxidoreductase [Mycobacteroides abscessus]MDM1905903.1 SDR family NAD(P)-dependent oxidoreductase [Mycobacteroides abscessus]MDM1910698.1 SDR family NAD(P)-dependent oxidoreductase [Mycobacteroides abscessus]MDM1919314.1 SDR family NAD(P)-dependent oxidoreductase [Mycobacteroides abscessus]
MITKKIYGQSILVTGGSRGIGRVIIEEFKRRGAGKIYAGVRDTSTIVDPEIVPLELDITDPASVQIAAANASDVEIVVNNAGLLIATSALGADLDDARRQLEVNYLGTLSMAQAFAPVIEENGGGVIVNLLSTRLGSRVAPSLRTEPARQHNGALPTHFAKSWSPGALTCLPCM